MGEAWRADLHPVGFVCPVGDEIDPEFALGVLHRGVRLALRHVHALGEILEVVYQFLHVGLHPDTWWGSDLVVFSDHRSRVPAQPVHALPDDAIRLAHFLDAHQVAVVAITIYSDRDVELEPVIDLVGLLPAQVPFDAGAAQHRSGESERHRAFRRNHTDAHSALLPDPVLGKQSLIFVHAPRKTFGEVFDEIEKRPLAVPVHLADRALVVDLRDLVLRHCIGQVPVYAAWTIVRGVHARAGHRLIDIKQILALAKAVQENRHGTEVKCVGAEREKMRENAGYLVEHHPDILGAQRDFDTEQLLYRHDVGVLVAHHRRVVEPVHIRNRLEVRPVFGELLGSAVQQPDVRVGALDHLAIKLQHQPQHPVRRGVLRAKIHGVVPDLRHICFRLSYNETNTGTATPCISVQANLAWQVNPAGRMQP